MSDKQLIDSIKLLYTQLIYNDLGLKKIEEEIKIRGIKSKKIENNEKYFIPSQYFFLLNDVCFDRITDDEKLQLENYIIEVNKGNSSVHKGLYEFLKSNMLKLLLPETNERYLYYGEHDFQHMAPSDSVVLGFHYMRFDEDYTEENDLKNERLINEKLNYIQNKLGPKQHIKVAVMKYDNGINSFLNDNKLNKNVR